MSASPLKGDYKVGGGWGDAINWFPDSSQFDTTPLADGAEYKVVGWKCKRPNVGQTLMAEFTNSWMLFEFTEVRLCDDPKDMFFATVTPVDQALKP